MGCAGFRRSSRPSISSSSCAPSANPVASTAARGSRMPKLLPHLEILTFMLVGAIGYTMYIRGGRLSSPDLHRLGAAADGDDAAARHLDEAERQHQLDELVDLVGTAGDLEHEALDGGVDHAGTERLGEPHRLDPLLA